MATFSSSSSNQPLVDPLILIVPIVVHRIKFVDSSTFVGFIDIPKNEIMSGALVPPHIEILDHPSAATSSGLVRLNVPDQKRIVKSLNIEEVVLGIAEPIEHILVNGERIENGIAWFRARLPIPAECIIRRILMIPHSPGPSTD